MNLKELRHAYFLKTLKECGDKASVAAQKVGVSYKGFRGWFYKYGTKVPSVHLGMVKAFSGDIKDVENEWIRLVMMKHGNDKVKVAAELGICRKTLYTRLTNMGLIALKVESLDVSDMKYRGMPTNEERLRHYDNRP